MLPKPSLAFQTFPQNHATKMSLHCQSLSLLIYVGYLIYIIYVYIIYVDILFLKHFLEHCYIYFFKKVTNQGLIVITERWSEERRV